MNKKIILSFENPKYEFDELKKFVTIPVLKLGTFFHTFFGKIEISQKKLSTMISNFHSDVVGRQLILDEDHTGGKSLGWWRNVYQLDDLLLADIVPTNKGFEYLRDQLYKYSSAEFREDYEDEHGKKHGPTLLGVALTNSPFLKMGEIKFSDKDIIKYNDQITYDFEEADNMDITKLKTEIETLTISVKEIKEKFELSDQRLQETEKKLDAKEKIIKELNDDKIKREDAIQKRENELEFNKLLSQGKVVESQRESYYSNDFKEFVKNSAELNSGKGYSKESTEIEATAEDMVFAKTKELSEKDGIDFSSALDKVLDSNPDLATSYFKEVGGAQ